jgi:hypothetical protein
VVGFVSLPISGIQAEGLVRSKSQFYYRHPSSGKVVGAPIVRHYNLQITTPSAEVDPRLDPTLQRAASIAQERASAHSKARCWRYVKQALLDAGAVDSYPKSAYGCQAGEELVRDFGFQKLPIRDPYAAPVGAVLVYGKGSGGAGHVELRTQNGFVSDYHSKNRCYYPLLAIYGKFNS